MEKGFVLVSTPHVVGDIDFHRSVIILINNSDKNYMGFIINKKLDFSLKEITKKIKKHIPLYYGGPVERDNLFYIYKSKIKVNGTEKLTNDISWGGDFDEILDLINKNIISKNDIKFFMGDSGWSDIQLNNEIEDNSWELFDNPSQLMIFSNKTDMIWKSFIMSFGNKYILWSNLPENPNHN